MVKSHCYLAGLSPWRQRKKQMPGAPGSNTSVLFWVELGLSLGSCWEDRERPREKWSRLAETLSQSWTQPPSPAAAGSPNQRASRLQRQWKQPVWRWPRDRLSAGTVPSNDECASVASKLRVGAEPWDSRRGFLISLRWVLARKAQRPVSLLVTPKLGICPWRSLREARCRPVSPVGEDALFGSADGPIVSPLGQELWQTEWKFPSLCEGLLDRLELALWSVVSVQYFGDSSPCSGGYSPCLLVALLLAFLSCSPLAVRTLWLCNSSLHTTT